MKRKIAVLTAGVAVFAILAAGCSKKHEDFPDPLGVSVPQNVINLTVANPQGLDYDLSWGVNDPGTVQYYRVYSSFDGVTFALAQDSLATTFAAFTSFVPVSAFGVSVVSNENVEGAMVVEETP